MKFQLRTRGLRFSDKLCRYVEHRLCRALGRLARGVGRVRIALLAGPRGRGAVVCRIRAETAQGRVLVTETERDAFDAVSGACERAGAVLSHRLTARIERRLRRRVTGDRAA